MKYQYKVVPAPKIVRGDSAEYFQNAINQEAAQGWEFVNMFAIEEKQGCFLNPQFVKFNMLVFVHKS